MTPENGNTADAPPTDEPRDLYPVNDAAYRLGITPRKLWSIVGADRIRTVKLDGRRLIPADALAEFIAALPDAGHSAVERDQPAA